jgi:hypothetical protein
VSLDAARSSGTLKTWVAAALVSAAMAASPMSAARIGRCAL